MSQQRISRAQRIRLFLREYYLGHSVWRNGVRMLGGPLVLFEGLNLATNNPGRAVWYYGAFCALFGFYFTLKPFIIIATRSASFQDSTFEITVTAQEIRWIKAGVESAHSFADFRSILRRPSCYLLEIGDAGTVYLLAGQLTADERRLLDAHVAA